ncbi:GDP-mannose 4,6-dehydratase [Pedobacter sp. SYSU D00535]|uniref:GDP-mannose 4,6-dehydratase n=1 Tax=Pedobacter sp. SYSU D00535 TaxID=2810308 RepID=UPI001A966C6F|nr:GDP-mannose 4,6-dehydratase [Pedobacter sp. SYSU D00535]
MKHVLVTGGAGFIGSNLVKALLAKDYKVTVIDNFDTFYPRQQKESNLSEFRGRAEFALIEGDIRQMADLEKAEGVDVIIHLAAKAGVRPSIKNPILYQDVNVSGTQNLLEFARTRGIKQFVFASSSSVYGVNENVPWHEEEKLLPISPYASTKLSGEMLGHVYSHLYGIRFLALRFFTVYGPGQRPDLAIHKFFKSILRNEAIPVYGDGSTSRDYTFVQDTVKGILAAVEYEETNFEIINLGNHKTVTLAELISAIEQTCNKSAIIDRQHEQPGDVPRTYANISKAQRLLGYNPSTELMEGLDAFYQWFKEKETVLL